MCNHSMRAGLVDKSYRTYIDCKLCHQLGGLLQCWIEGAIRLVAFRNSIFVEWNETLTTVTFAKAISNRDSAHLTHPADHGPTQQSLFGGKSLKNEKNVVFSQKLIKSSGHVTSLWRGLLLVWWHHVSFSVHAHSVSLTSTHTHTHTHAEIRPATAHTWILAPSIIQINLIISIIMILKDNK